MNNRSALCEVAARCSIDEIIIGITAVIMHLFEEPGAEQEFANNQLKEKRRALFEYHQDLIGRLPLEERLKLGKFRF